MANNKKPSDDKSKIYDPSKGQGISPRARIDLGALAKSKGWTEKELRTVKESKRVKPPKNIVKTSDDVLLDPFINKPTASEDDQYRELKIRFITRLKESKISVKGTLGIKVVRAFEEFPK